jgi:adenylate cyclase
MRGVPELGKAKQRLSFAGFMLDIDDRTLIGPAGVALTLTPAEFDLLSAFVRAPSRVLSRDHLRLSVSGRGSEAYDRSVDVLVGRLRRKIEPDPEMPTLIITVMGAGYKFAPRVTLLPLVDPRTDAATHPIERPSIAVMPFENLTGDPAQEYFVDGIVEEIVTALSQVRWFLVIARNSSFAYKGRVTAAKDVGRELGVRYMLTGSVRKAGTRVRITTSLVDTETEAQVWTDRFDGVIDDIFDLQDAITASVAGAIEPKLQNVEAERSRRQRPSNPTAYDCYLRALALFYSETRDGIEATLRLLAGAMETDPTYAPPFALAAECLVYRVDCAWSEDRGRDKFEAGRLANAALQKDRDDPTVLVLAAHVLAYTKHDYIRADSLITRAIALNANCALAYQLGGWNKIYAGDPAGAVEWFGRGKHLSPIDSKSFIYDSGIAYALIMLGRDEEALRWGNKAVAANALWMTGHRAVASALAHLGRVDEAKTVGLRVCQEVPGYRLRNTRELMQPSAGLDRYLEGLSLAGIPE